MKFIKYIAFGLLSLSLIIFVLLWSAGISPIAMNLHDDIYQENGYAIGGYDVVAYHTENIAKKGDEALTIDWKGVKWLFSTKANQQLFQDSPEQYIPELGGHCAFAVSKGAVAPGNLQVWHIDEGKLYFFSDNKVKEESMKDFNLLKEVAFENWND